MTFNSSFRKNEEERKQKSFIYIPRLSIYLMRLYSFHQPKVPMKKKKRNRGYSINWKKQSMINQNKATPKIRVKKVFLFIIKFEWNHSVSAICTISGLGYNADVNFSFWLRPAGDETNKGFSHVWMVDFCYLMKGLVCKRTNKKLQCCLSGEHSTANWVD